jgi:hypothetical protein
VRSRVGPSAACSTGSTLRSTATRRPAAPRARKRATSLPPRHTYAAAATVSPVRPSATYRNASGRQLRRRLRPTPPARRRPRWCRTADRERQLFARVERAGQLPHRRLPLQTTAAGRRRSASRPACPRRARVRACDSSSKSDPGRTGRGRWRRGGGRCGSGRR